MRMRLTLLLLVLALFPSTALASEIELLNLYDAFGKHRDGTVKDFGFSVLIRYQGKSILFDAGTNPEVLQKNAAALGINLSEVDFAVASHAHADHTGGFHFLKRVNPRVKIYFANDFFGSGGDLDFDVSGREPEAAEELAKEQRYFDGKSVVAKLRSKGLQEGSSVFVKKHLQIADGINLILTRSPNIGYFTRYPGVDLNGRPLVEGTAATFLGLPELSLSLKTSKGEVLFVGCSHSTVEEIVSVANRELKSSVYLLAGGFHLLPYTRKDVAGVASRLKARVRKVAPAHCTGHLAFQVLQETFADDYLFFGLGSSIRE